MSTAGGETTSAHAPSSQGAQHEDEPERDRLLGGLRRLMRLADGATDDPQDVLRALAGELFALLGADEVHIHRLLDRGPLPREPLPETGDPVVVFMFGGEGRLGYEVPRTERPPGVAWVASTGQRVRLVGVRELAGAVPRLGAAEGAESALLLPLAVREEVEAVVVVLRHGTEHLDERDAQRAAALVDQAAVALALLRARAEAGTDAVTGCMNHRAMRRRLDEEIARVARTEGRLSCLLLDLDDFKLVNDRHGHPAGDAQLRGVARALAGEFRAFDRVARYGGDEFVVILPNADLQSAALAAERALQRLAELPSFDAAPGVRASIGAAQWQPPMSADELLAACDGALLRSKRAGKGRVERAERGSSERPGRGLSEEAGHGSVERAA
jgi:diguanylate cyclase (GGDEF)-like protein